MVTGLLKPWAVWLLNKRAAVPAVGTGKPQRWLPGTRGSRLVSVSPCPPSPFFFCCAPRCCQAAPSHPSLAPSPSSWGSVLCSVLCPARCSTAQPCSIRVAPAGHRAWAMLLGHRRGTCFHPGLAKLHPCILPSSLPCSDTSPPAENAVSQSPQAGTDAQPLAWRPHWWPFLGRCPLFSCLPLPPPLPPKTSVLFHCVAKQDFHRILVSRPALPFVIHQAPSGAWRSTSPHAGSPGSPGTRGPGRALAPGWHTQKPCPRAAAARFPSHVHFTSTQ